MVVTACSGCPSDSSVTPHQIVLRASVRPTRGGKRTDWATTVVPSIRRVNGAPSGCGGLSAPGNKAGRSEAAAAETARPRRVARAAPAIGLRDLGATKVFECLSHLVCIVVFQ